MIPVNRPVLDGNEERYLIECIRTGWISSEGPYVKRLEEAVAHLVGVQFGVAVSSGSAALDIAVAALRIGPGDEVILPSFTIISCVAAVLHAGAIPIFVDCERESWNLDPRLVAEKITARTKAIMVVHIYGLPVDMDPILALAKDHGLYVIEDAAEQLGQTYNDRPVGSLGDITAVSFYPNKHLTTGEGGMVLTNNPDLAERCRSLRNLCFDRERRYIHTELGWNYRMSNVQAALGVAQIERHAEFIQKKRQIGARYRQYLDHHPQLEIQPHKMPYAENIYWVFGVVLDESVPFDAQGAIQRMRSQGVDCRHFFWPLNKQPVLKERGVASDARCPNAERIALRGLYLPSGLGNTEQEIDTAAQALLEILRV